MDRGKYLSLAVTLDCCMCQSCLSPLFCDCHRHDYPANPRYPDDREDSRYSPPSLQEPSAVSDKNHSHNRQETPGRTSSPRTDHLLQRPAIDPGDTSRDAAYWFVWYPYCDGC